MSQDSGPVNLREGRQAGPRAGAQAGSPATDGADADAAVEAPKVQFELVVHYFRSDAQPAHYPPPPFPLLRTHKQSSMQSSYARCSTQG